MTKQQGVSRNAVIVGDMEVTTDWRLKRIGVYVLKPAGTIVIRGNHGNPGESTFLGSQRIASLNVEGLDALISLLQRARIASLQVSNGVEPDWLVNQRKTIPWVGKHDNETTGEEVEIDDEEFDEDEINGGDNIE